MQADRRPTKPKALVRTLATETAHERHSRLYNTAREAYSHGRPPPRPKTKLELDVLKERNQFIRDADADPSSLDWEDALALKYYNSLFREYAVANLKHYKSGAIALRWRTETEVLAGIAHLTCGSMRCRYHEPPPDAYVLDPDSIEPLIAVDLTEFEVPFAYVEEGQRKSALVKLVLCEECGKKLLYGRAKGKKDKQDALKGTVLTQTEEDRKGSVGGTGEGSSRDDRSRSRPSSSRRRSASPERRR